MDQVHVERELSDGPRRAPRASDTDAMLHRLQRELGNSGMAAVLQREVGAEENDAAPVTSPVLDVVGRGGGTALDTEVRSDMEQQLGADFSDVRVHRGSEAEASARAVGARAYTVGNEIVFGGGAWDPGSTDGRRTIAHELTHVVQQRSGPVDGTSTGDGVAVSHPGDRFEREASETAERVVSGGWAHGTIGGAGPAASHAVQREAVPEGEDVQMLQREGAPEEEEDVQMLQREESPEEVSEDG